MILEAVRMCADWLANADFGVNALLSSTPVDTGDSIPANVTIYDETRNDIAARGDVPDTLPALIVTSDRVDQLDGQVVTITADGQVTLRFRYVIDAAATANGIRDASYVMRTALRSLRELFALGSGDAARTRNSIYLETCLQFNGVGMWTPMGDGVLTFGFTATIQMRDLAP